MLLYTTPRLPHTATHYMSTYGNKVGLQMMELVLTPAITKTGLMNQTPQSWYQTLLPVRGSATKTIVWDVGKQSQKDIRTQRNCGADKGSYNTRQGRH